MRRFAVENGIGQAEDIEARTVGYRRLHGFNTDLATLGHQLEFFDFLGGSQQVALDPGRDQFNGVLAGGQSGLGQALTDPARQLVGIHRPDLHELGVLAFNQCLAPLGFLRAAIQLGQADQQHCVFGRTRAILDERGSPFVTGFT
ncbi:hypothetical protein D3C87_1642370 [compost metagenome]